MSENRENCVLCGSKIVLKYTTQLPVFMGTIQNIINYKISPYTICECVVICSHTGPYYDEIFNQLKRLNEKIEII
jgi:hypothetical protein